MNGDGHHINLNEDDDVWLCTLGWVDVDFSD